MQSGKGYKSVEISKMTERRKDKREQLMEIVNYAPYPSNSVLRGFIKDWSGSGLCLITFQPLREGQEIIMDTIVAPSSKKAVVRWQQKDGSASYKVGLEFRR
jgi:hypothetical protein